MSNATIDAGPMVICRTEPNIMYITPPKHAEYSPNYQKKKKKRTNVNKYQFCLRI